MAEGAHIVAGLIDDMPDALQHIRLPAKATVTLVFPDTVEVEAPFCATRAPLINEQGSVRALPVKIKQLGSEKAVALKWKPQEIKIPVGVSADASSTGLLRCMVFDRYLLPSEAAALKTHPQLFLSRAMFTKLLLGKEDVLDIFAVKLMKQQVYTALVRVKKEKLQSLMTASGQHGIFFKPHVRETPEGMTHSVQWIKKRAEERHEQYLRRAQAEEAAQSPRLGIACSTTASLGL